MVWRMSIECGVEDECLVCLRLYEDGWGTGVIYGRGWWISIVWDVWDVEWGVVDSGGGGGG